MIKRQNSCVPISLTNLCLMLTRLKGLWGSLIIRTGSTFQTEPTYTLATEKGECVVTFKFTPIHLCSWTCSSAELIFQLVCFRFRIVTLMKSNWIKSEHKASLSFHHSSPTNMRCTWWRQRTTNPVSLIGRHSTLFVSHCLSFTILSTYTKKASSASGCSAGHFPRTYSTYTGSAHQNERSFCQWDGAIHAERWREKGKPV